MFVAEENLPDFFDLRGKIRLSLWLLPILLNCFDASFTLYVFRSRASASFYFPSLLYAHSNKQYNNIQSLSLPCYYFLFRRKRNNIYRNIYNATLCHPRCCLHITGLRYLFVTWKSEKCIGVNDSNAFNTNSHHELCYLEEIYLSGIECVVNPNSNVKLVAHEKVIPGPTTLRANLRVSWRLDECAKQLHNIQRLTHWSSSTQRIAARIYSSVLSLLPVRLLFYLIFF